MPSIRILVCVACLQNAVYAQNLVPNPSFEVYTECPSNFLLGEPLQAIPWYSANTLSPDYYNACCDGCAVDVPDNLGGFQAAHTGNAHAGLYCRVIVDRREYLTAPLLSPLDAGTTYYVEFYISPSEFACNTKPIGALFTVGAPIYDGELVLDNYTPQVHVNGDFLDNYEGWTLVSGCFVANGGENQITLGNFLNDAQTPVNSNCHAETISFDRSYYLIDDVLVEAIPTEELFLELGGPVTSCDSYTIDPGIPDVVYHWENGSGEPTLTVTESGTYSLTISQGCNTGVDSIEVVVPESILVQLPDDLVTLCSPSVYEVELDPNLGEYTWSHGATGPSISISAGGVYTVFLDDGCSVSSDTVEVVVHNAPEPFTLGEDFVLCPDEEVTFAFDPEIGEFTWQNGQHNSTFTIVQEGVYSLTITNDCGTETDEVEVTSLDLPVVDLGESLQYICDEEPIIFSFDPDQGEYQWQDDSDEAYYEIYAPGQYYVFVVNECGEAYDEIYVEQLSSPVASLGLDTLFCEGDTILLTSTEDNATYHWQDNSVENEFIVTEPGVYSLTVTNACGIGSDSVEIGLHLSLGIPDLGEDIILCQGESVILSPAVENASYLWQDNSTADSLLVNEEGIYYVSVYNMCDFYTDTIHIALSNNPPNLNLEDNSVLCQGDSIVIYSGVTGVDFLWNNGTILDSLIVTQPGSYTLTVSNACGTDADTVIVSDGGFFPVISIGNDFSICPGEEMLIAANGEHFESLTWSDGSMGDSLLVSEPGTISIRAENACGVAVDTVLVTLLEPTPSFSVGEDTSICTGTVLILQSSLPGLNLLWSDGSQGDQLSVTGEGVYFASLTGVCGVNADTIVITLLPLIPDLDLGVDRSLCPGDSIFIDPEILNVEYAWNDGSFNDSIIVFSPGQIILTIENQCGQATDTLEIFESTEGPQVDLGADILACEGDTIILTAGVENVQYAWQDGSTAETFSVVRSGEFIVKVTNSCGTDSDTIMVELSGIVPLPYLGPDTTLCEGSTIVLLSHAPIGTQIIWQDQSSFQQFIVSQPGLYILTEQNHCGEMADSVLIDYASPPFEINLGVDTLLCPGEKLILTVPVTENEIVWQDGSDANSFEAIAGGFYSVVISNACGVVSDEIYLEENSDFPVVSLDEYFLCPGSEISIDVTQPFAAEYFWGHGDVNPFVTIQQTGEYVVTIYTTCYEITKVLNVIENPDCTTKEVFIPNVFSPNDDGINDVFTLGTHPDLDIISIHGLIYDRWGNLLFESTGPEFNWNGKRANEIMMPGVYVFNLEWVVVVNGVEIHESIVGDVSLIR